MAGHHTLCPPRVVADSRGARQVFREQSDSENHCSVFYFSLSFGSVKYFTSKSDDIYHKLSIGNKKTTNDCSKSLLLYITALPFEPDCVIHSFLHWSLHGRVTCPGFGVR